MTPGARVQAAIDALEAMADGLAAEQALTRWARGARYAGSKDRAAVRDHVYSVLRRKTSCAALGGGPDARALMLGLVRAEGQDPEALFSGAGHAPPPLSAEESQGGTDPSPQEARDLPAWLWDRFVDALGERAAAEAAEALRHRAPVALRVNMRKAQVAGAIAHLSSDQITVAPVTAVDGALIVEEGARRITQSAAYRDGLVELQDVSSQAAMAAVEVPEGGRVLDYCAGGGGKTLALAARHTAQWFAHDAAPQRMRDLATRADRAGVSVSQVSTPELSEMTPFDLVVCDVPCSGSGTWRRTPEAKWALNPERLRTLLELQRDILAEAAKLIRPGGQLVYCTCSVLREENEAQIEAFVTSHPDWRTTHDQRWPISKQGDGFYLARLSRA